MKTQIIIDTTFEENDFSGCGQYIVTTNKKIEKPKYTDSYLLTMISKIGYGDGKFYKISLSDGLTCELEGVSNKQELAGYCTDYKWRMATREEVLRAIKAQDKYRFYK